MLDGLVSLYLPHLLLNARKRWNARRKEVVEEVLAHFYPIRIANVETVWPPSAVASFVKRDANAAQTAASAPRSAARRANGPCSSHDPTNLERISILRHRSARATRTTTLVPSLDVDPTKSFQ